MAEKEKHSKAIHWFRKNLRLHDNPALCEALNGSSEVLGLYVLPPCIPADGKLSANQWNFLMECLEDLERGLRCLGCQLLVIQGYPVQVIPKLLSNLEVSKLTFETENEPFGKQRDAVVTHLAESAGVKVVSCSSHSLYNTECVIKANCNKVPVLFTDFLDVISTIGPPEFPVKTVNEESFPTLINNENKFIDYHIPSLEDIGIQKSNVTCEGIWHGGETVALKKLEDLLKEMMNTDFQMESNSETFFHNSVDNLSPFLRFGCLSPRTLYHAISSTYYKAKQCNPPLSFFNFLLWRDFYFLIGSKNPTFHQIENNPLCLQIEWEDNDFAVQQWKKGQTGFPFIDAVMRQLCLEGWIPDVAAQVVGCFLTKGCMWINWQEGFKVFGEIQLDVEWSINAGKWLSISGNVFDRNKPLEFFCPVDSGRKMDPSGEYIRKYVPELRSFPTKYLFEPWKTPKPVQQASGCIIGENYPLPLVDHKEHLRKCQKRLEELAQSMTIQIPVMQSRHTSVHLFRKDLRLHDNPTLRSCLNGSETFYPVYILDTAAAKQSKISANRWNFLLESLRDLDKQLARLGSRLFVVRGRAVEVLPELISDWGITRISFETDCEPFGAQRDAVIQHIAEKSGVEVVSKTSHTLFEPSQIVDANRGKISMLFKEFLKVIKENKLSVPSPVKEVNRQLVGNCVTPVAVDHQRKYGVPELNELGVKDIRCVTSAGLWRGGEQEALRRLGLLEKELVKNDFEEVLLSAASMTSSKTHLSPYLRFGCLSPRMMWESFTDCYVKSKGTIPPMSLYKPLLLREFFFTIASTFPGLHKMNNNPLSIQYPWEENAEGLQRWKNGTTGFPWIDAVMRQLRTEGWIPHMARQAVGCFLTRGCLWINWEEGFKVFEELQLDAEWSLNVGNWLWLSGSTFVKEHVPWFCPVEVGKKVDPNGEYVRKYVPELKGLPAEYLFEPWKAPAFVQQAAGCILGEDYPFPLVDHKEKRRECVIRLKEVTQRLVAESPEMQNGHTSVHLFRKDLRLHDNPTLRSCLNGSETFYPVYILDTTAAKQSKISANRWNFLLESLRDLDNQLARLGSRLFVVQGRAVEVLPELISDWGITRISFETDCEPFGAQRDAVIRHIAEKSGVEVVSKTSHTLFEPSQIVDANRGKISMLFKEFVKVIEVNKLSVPSPVKEVNRQLVGNCVTPVAVDHQRKYGVPELNELGVKDIRCVTSAGLWRGGEQEALRRLGLLEKELVKNDFEEVPLSAASMTSSKTHLSPYLRFGCLSPRMMWESFTDCYVKSKGTIPPMSLYKPLLLREFFFTIASTFPGLHKMDNNPLSMQYPWEENAEGLQRWKNGTTGFPWIDAVMRQLRTEGWIPYMARQAVGCFLTRGCLWINWEEGFKVFEELQLDAEWSLNVGNWLWLSGSTFVKEHVPWFCPVEVGKKVDPNGEYVRRYVSELKRLPLQYLFEPWKAPLAVQKAARCVVGDDYPEPLANHIEQRKICVRRLKDMCNTLNISGHISLHWFRKDLRLHDNPTLRDCLVDSAVFYGVYILDSCAEARLSPNRWRFLLESLKDLDASLAEYGSRLFVLEGRPLDVLPSLFEQWGITRLSFEVDCEPDCKTRDMVVTTVAKKAGIQVISHVSHTLYDTKALLKSPEGRAPQLFDEFQKLVVQLGRPQKPVPRVDRKLFGSCVTPVGRDHDTRYGVPAPDIQKLHSSGSWFYQGGEREALSRMEAALCEMVKNDFCEPLLTARSLMPSQYHLSPHLRLGCLSPRLLYQRMTEEYIKCKAMNPSFDLFKKLLWREFFFVVGSQVSDLHEMISNPVSLQIPWEEDPEHLEKWKQGMTGFPWIDAIMRQLRLEGWIHDIARRAVGSFLTRGCLWINWREGFKVFEELQLDSERSLNAGNWLWLSGSTFVKEHVPWFCPVEVGKKVDPSGEYVRKYLPEVRNLPTEFIFEPWLAPCELQESCGCVIGRDYPAPIVNHLEQRVVCVQRLLDLALTLTAT